MFMRNIKILLLVTIVAWFQSSNLLYAQKWVKNQDIESSGNVRIISSDVDGEDNIYIAGHFEISIGDSLDSYGNFDYFLAKFDKSLNPLWIKRIGSDQKDFYFQGLGLDDQDNIFITGIFQDTCVFDEGQDTLISEGSFDVFLAKYDKAGQFQWKKNLVKAPSKQWINSLDIDLDNNVVLAGYYRDSCIIDNDTLRGAGINSYIVKTNNNGYKIWTKNIINTTTYGSVTSVKTFSDGYYFNGYFSGDLYLDVKTISSYDPTKGDVYLYKTDFDGVGDWVRQSYGNGNDFTGTITQDSTGGVYFTGYFSGTEFFSDIDDTNVSTEILSTNGGDDIFIIKYTRLGDLLWTKGYGGIGDDVGKVIQTKSNNLIISGYFADKLVFGDDTIRTSSSTDNDIFIAGLDNEGNTLFASSLYAEGANDQSDIMEIASSGVMTVGGAFQAPNIVIGSDTIYNSTGTFNGILAQFIPELSATFTGIQDPTCNQNANGELIITPYFGVSPYTYSWSHNAGLIDSTATGLSAGTYTVTVTDALDSTDVAQYTLTEPAAFTFNPAITQVTTCSYSAQGAINLNVSGGNGGNTYYWFESDGGSGVTLTTEDQSGLTTGTYNVTVTDSEGCNADTAIVISGPAPVTFGASTNTPYTGADPTTGAIDLELSGGTGTPSAYDASWTGISGYTASTQDITGLDPGNYTVTVTDNNSCEFDTTFSVLDNDVFFSYIADYKDACKGTNNGWAIADYYSPDGSTNISYIWDANAGSQTTARASNLAAGRYYYVTVTDNDNSVSNTDSVYINALTYDFTGSLSGSSSAVDCKGDSDGFIDLEIESASPGVAPYAYAWSSSQTTQDIVNIPAGTYSVTVTDANECSFSIADYTITEPEFALAATASIVSQPLCNGNNTGEVTVDANGGNGTPFTYQWNDPALQKTQNAKGLYAGNYSVTVTDWKGCKASSAVTLTQPQAISVSGVIGDLSCYNDGSGTIALTVGGGTVPHSYVWETATGTGLVATDKNQSGLSAATYHVTITDANLCELEDSFVVAQPDQLQIDSEDQLNIAGCFGDNTGSITIVASGGTGALTYTLNPGAIAINSTGLFEDLYSGTYSVEVDDENGCGPLTSSSIEITEPLEIVIDSAKTTNATASDASDGVITVYASGGTGNLEYTLTPGDVVNATGIFDNLTPGDYIVNVNDENLCEVSTNSITVSFTDNIDLVDLNKYIQIYPNPTSSKISVDINLTDLNDVKIEILSTSGEILESRFVFQHDNIREEFDLSAYSKGIYFIRIHSDKANYTNKIVLH